MSIEMTLGNFLLFTDAWDGKNKFKKKYKRIYEHRSYNKLLIWNEIRSFGFLYGLIYLAIKICS